MNEVRELWGAHVLTQPEAAAATEIILDPTDPFGTSHTYRYLRQDAVWQERFSSKCISGRALADLVESLGPGSRSDDLKPLRENGRDAVSLLIARLQPIPEKKVLHDDQNSHREAMNVVWALRGLRYLTGKDFRAPTAHVFGADENERRREELLKKDDGTVTRIARFSC